MCSNLSSTSGDAPIKEDPDTCGGVARQQYIIFRVRVRFLTEGERTARAFPDESVDFTVDLRPEIAAVPVARAYRPMRDRRDILGDRLRKSEDMVAMAADKGLPLQYV